MYIMHSILYLTLIKQKYFISILFLHKPIIYLFV